VSNPSDRTIKAWPQGYTLYPHHYIQHDMMGSDMPDMVPHAQVNIPITTSHVEPHKNKPVEFDQSKQQLQAHPNPHQQLNAQ